MHLVVHSSPDVLRTVLLKPREQAVSGDALFECRLNQDGLDRITQQMDMVERLLTCIAERDYLAVDWREDPLAYGPYEVIGECLDLNPVLMTLQHQLTGGFTITRDHDPECSLVDVTIERDGHRETYLEVP